MKKKSGRKTNRERYLRDKYEMLLDNDYKGAFGTLAKGLRTKLVKAKILKGKSYGLDTEVFEEAVDIKQLEKLDKIFGMSVKVDGKVQELSFGEVLQNLENFFREDNDSEKSKLWWLFYNKGERRKRERNLRERSHYGLYKNYKTKKEFTLEYDEGWFEKRLAKALKQINKPKLKRERIKSRVVIAHRDFALRQFGNKKKR